MSRPYYNVNGRILREELNRIEFRIAKSANMLGVRPGDFPQTYWDIREELLIRGWPLPEPGKASWAPSPSQFPQSPPRAIIYKRQVMMWPPPDPQKAEELGWPAGDTLEAKLAEIEARRGRGRPEVTPLVPLPAKPKPQAPRPTPEQENPPRKFDFDAEDS